MKRSRQEMKRTDDLAKAYRSLRAGMRSLSIASSTSVKDLVCRDEYAEAVSNFLSSPSEKTLQLFGMPGTGKTATVRHALAAASLADHSSSAPTAVFLNGYVIQKSTDIYWTLYTHFQKTRGGLPKKVSVDECAALIERRLTQGWPRQTASLCVIIMDEVDKIMEKHPRCIFRVIDWLSLRHAHCKLITISNSMDLRSGAKTQSRIDNTKELVFHPYNAEQLKVIFLRRVRGIQPPPFSNQAIAFLCLQIASHNGDVRRLLQTACTVICSVLMEIKTGASYAYNAREGVISVRSVHGVVRQIFHDRFVEFIRSVQSAILFVVVALCGKYMRELYTTDSNAECNISVDTFYSYFLQACTRCGIDKKVPRIAFLDMMETLRDVGLIDVTSGRDRLPVRGPQWVTDAAEDFSFSLLQPHQAVLDSCRLHPLYGARAHEILL